MVDVGDHQGALERWSWRSSKRSLGVANAAVEWAEDSAVERVPFPSLGGISCFRPSPRYRFH